MMIIDCTDNSGRTGLSTRGRLEFWRERMEANPGDRYYERQYRHIQKEAAACGIEVAPIYVPNMLTPHQEHAFKEEKSSYDGKNKPAQADSPGERVVLYAICAVLSVCAGVMNACDGNAVTSIGCFVIALFSAILTAMESKEIIENRKIACVEKNAIPAYPLDSPVFEPLSKQLGEVSWSRLIESLNKHDDRELQRIFVNYYEDVSEREHLAVEAQTSSIDKAVSDELVSDLNQKIDEIAADTADDIFSIFMRYDAEALEAAESAAKKAEEEQCKQLAKAEADEVATNSMIVSKAARLIAQPRRT